MINFMINLLSTFTVYSIVLLDLGQSRDSFRNLKGEEGITLLSSMWDTGQYEGSMSQDRHFSRTPGPTKTLGQFRLKWDKTGKKRATASR